MGNLYIVGTPIGNLNDITLRALEILKNVNIIACEDTRQTLKLLNHFEIKNKLVAYHKFNEKEKSPNLIKELQNGKDIALVTDAGTPCVSDPGYFLVKEARENDINVFAIPGASASVSALSISGLDSNQFTFIGFLPTDDKKMKEEIIKIRESKIHTFILYESPKRLVETIERISIEFPKSNIYIASDMTKLHERGFYGKIENVLETIKKDDKIEKGEYVIILQKEQQKIINKEETESLESLLVDYMVKNSCSLKEAVNNIGIKNNTIRKNDLYQASLRLKSMFEK